MKDDRYTKLFDNIFFVLQNKNTACTNVNNKLNMSAECQEHQIKQHAIIKDFKGMYLQ